MKYLPSSVSTQFQLNSISKQITELGTTQLKLVFKNFVKLQSDIRILTQLQLVGVGVNFTFPLEGRKEPTPGL